MKLMLVMHICSALYNTCPASIVVPEIYDDYNTCITEGYVRSLNSLKEMGEEDVNKYMIFIKFVCQQDTRIDT
jgi:hypothetical protein